MSNSNERAEWIRSRLQEKHDLLVVMLKLTESFYENISRDGDSDPIVDETDTFLEKRMELIRRVDAIDKELMEAGPDELKLYDDLNMKTHELLVQLNDLQSKIDIRLAAARNGLRDKAGRARTSRKGLKGYYNGQMASKPRFVDDKG